MKRVVIVGGGFGGLFAARALARSDYQVTLMDRRNFHTFQPLLYQVATGALTTGDIATPYRLVLRGCNNVNPLLAEARGVDPQRRVVIHDGGEVPYDILIVATGAKHSYFGKDEWGRYAPGLKTLEHALDIRRRIFSVLEQAETEADADRQRALMTFVVVGAGPTGVELAGALGELTRHLMNGDFRRIDPRQARILLIEAAADVLPVMEASLRQAARKSLEQLGVTVMTNTKVQEMGATQVSYAVGDRSETIQTHTILWAAGVQVSDFGRALAAATAAATDRAGRLNVGTDLSLPAHPDIFVIGDLAHCEDAGCRTVPGLAPAAIQMGEHVARLLLARDKGKAIAPFRYKDRGSMAVIGRNHAVGDLHWLRVSGFTAWLLWILVHIMSLIQPEKRLRVFVQWAWRYFSNQSGDRLITGDRRGEAGKAASANTSSSPR
jgi:NADH dehydrogenase